MPFVPELRAPIPQAINSRREQCGACFVCGTRCDETCAANPAANKVSGDWRIRRYKVITTAITDFQNDLADLLVEWTVLNNWLAYRHMVSYWLGLVEWRNSVYNDQPYKPVLEAASPSSRLHHAKQFLLSSVRLLRPTDEGYFKLTCSSFRQVQREHQKVFCKAVEELERKYMAVAGKKRLARVRRRLEDRTGKFFPVTKEFDPDMPVGERNLVGDIEYGTAGRHRLGEILAHVGKEWRM